MFFDAFSKSNKIDIANRFANKYHRIKINLDDLYGSIVIKSHS